MQNFTSFNIDECFEENKEEEEEINKEEETKKGEKKYPLGIEPPKKLQRCTASEERQMLNKHSKWSRGENIDDNIIQEHESKGIQLSSNDWILIQAERMRIKKILESGEKKYATNIESQLPSHLTLSQLELNIIFYYGVHPNTPEDLAIAISAAQCRELSNREWVSKS